MIYGACLALGVLNLWCQINSRGSIKGQPIYPLTLRRCQWPSIRCFGGVFFFFEEEESDIQPPPPSPKQKRRKKNRFFGWGNYDEIGQNLKELHHFGPFLHHIVQPWSFENVTFTKGPDFVHFGKPPGTNCMVEAVSHFKARNVEGGQPQSLVEAEKSRWNAWKIRGGFLFTRLEVLSAMNYCEMTGECFQNVLVDVGGLPK